jgi:hypothetical protein
VSDLEDEIKAKFRLLDNESQQRLLRELTDEMSMPLPKISWDEWLTWADVSRAYLQAKYGDINFNSVDMLNEARKEYLRALMGDD